VRHFDNNITRKVFEAPASVCYDQVIIKHIGDLLNL